MSADVKMNQSMENNSSHEIHDMKEKKPELFLEIGVANPAFNDETPNKTYGNENLCQSVLSSDLMCVSKGLSKMEKKGELHIEDTGTSNCEVDPDTLCGIGSFKPDWLQPWATPRTFLFLYSLLGVISGTYYAYRVGVISTIEKRFSFNSRISGTIMVVDEVTPIFMGALIGYFGGTAHRPRMFAVGMLMSTLCCFISALPYVIYGPARHLNSLNIKNETEVEVCESGVVRDACHVEDRPPTMPAIIMFMIAGFLKGFGNLSYHAVGLSFLDDISKRKNSSMYLAITFALRLIGPTIGFLMSYTFLKIQEHPFGDELGYGQKDPRWIGAWWLGFVVQGIILLICTLPLVLFPKRLPGQKKIEKVSKEKASLKGMIATSMRILKNPCYLTLVVSDVFTVFGSLGHYLNLPKYMEHQFRLTASEASLMSGPPGIAAVMISFVTGGYLIWKYRPSAKVIVAMMAALEAISAIGFLLLMIPKCEKVQMANFGLNNEGLILNNTCNFDCSCSTKTMSPICGSDGMTTYFTPCFAGCTEKNNKTYSNCSCISDALVQEESFATEGFCVTDDCWSQALGYIITFPIIQFLSSLLKVQHPVLLMRCILAEDKSTALGMFEGLLCIFGLVPYLVAFGSLVDSTCLVWEKSCGETGNCWFYDTDQFSNILHALSAIFSACTACTLMVTFCLSGRFEGLYEEEGDDSKETNKKKIEAVKGDKQMSTQTKL